MNALRGLIANGTTGRRRDRDERDDDRFLPDDHGAKSKALGIG
jgi:hypothetical protein